MIAVALRVIAPVGQRGDASVGDWDIAAESAAQLLVNLVGSTLAGVLVLGVRRRHATRHRQLPAR